MEKTINGPRITIGADPEFFLETHQGNLKSAVGTVGGRKNAPVPLESNTRLGYFVQEDNVAVEFNIPPATDVEQFIDSIQWSVKAIEKEVARFGYRPRFSAAEMFPLPELNSPQAKVFGCEPDFNAWNHGHVNPRPSSTPSLRTCGGHIHVGLSEKVKILDMVKLMDLFLGVPSVMMDMDTQRRMLYGKAGAFRPTHYDTTSWEYRVLSNFWIQTPELTRWAYEQTVRAIKFGLDKIKLKCVDSGRTSLDLFFEKYDLMDDIQECINSSDVNLSQELIIKYDLATV